MKIILINTWFWWNEAVTDSADWNQSYYNLCNAMANIHQEPIKPISSENLSL